MAVSIVAGSAVVTGGDTGTAVVSATPTLPTGSTNLDRVVICGAATHQPLVPTGWTVALSVQVGGGTYGAGTGPRWTFAIWRDYDGAWAMPAVSLGSVSAGTIAVGAVTLRCGAGETFGTPVTTSGSDTTADTNFSTTGALITMATDSAILAVNSWPAGPGAISSTAISTPGATSGSQTTPIVNAGSATGNDAFTGTTARLITVGGDGTPGYTATLTNARTGGTVFYVQPLSFTAAPADAAAGADDSSVVQDAARDSTDTAAGVDAAAVVQDATRTATDAAAGADAVTATLQTDAAASDVAAGADAHTIALSLERTPADTAATADAAQVTQDRQATVSDAATAADTAQAVLSLTVTRDAQDTAGAVDAVTALLDSGIPAVTAQVVVVPAEVRVAAVAAEVRTLTVPAEVRAAIIH